MDSTIVLITGANSGVGFATSEVLACASDSFHVIMASRFYDEAQASMSVIEASGAKGSLSTMQLYVTDEKSIEEAAAYVEQNFRIIDLLVNNTAVSSMDPDIKTRFLLYLETNVIGPAMISAAFRPLLLNSQNPYSIYVSSCERILIWNASQKSVSSENNGNGECYKIRLKVFVMSPGFVRSNLRGTSEEAKSGRGKAGDPDVSGDIALTIMQGKGDADAGIFVHKNGVYTW